MKKAKVSVIMSTYNQANQVGKAVKSILNQTFSDFEFIIINDASTDKTRQVLSRFKDNRIKLMTNKQNLGLAKSLNKGIRQAQGKYIARMDSDDISYLNRIELQYNYMEDHAEVAVLGGAIELYGDRKGKIIKPTDHKTIFANLFFSNTIAHPTVFIRKKIIQKNNLYYDPRLRKAQDYNLWFKIGRHHKLNNLKNVLIKYNRQDRKIDLGRLSEYQNCVDITRTLMLKALNIPPSDDMLEAHYLLSHLPRKLNNSELYKIRTLLLKILLSNKSAKVFPVQKLEQVIARKWASTCLCRLDAEMVDRLKSCISSRLVIKLLEYPIQHAKYYTRNLFKR